MSDADTTGYYESLSSYPRCARRIEAAWPQFASRRGERLQQGLFGTPVEKIAENIPEDLFTGVLDWDPADVNLQIGRADIVLSQRGIKRLVLEVKRPGSLNWQRSAMAAAVEQAAETEAIQSILCNFRGVKVQIPREAIPDVLVRPGRAAAIAGKMPYQCRPAADAYLEAHQALDQLGRLTEVQCCTAVAWR